MSEKKCPCCTSPRIKQLIEADPLDYECVSCARFIRYVNDDLVPINDLDVTTDLALLQFQIKKGRDPEFSEYKKIIDRAIYAAGVHDAQRDRIEHKLNEQDKRRIKLNEIDEIKNINEKEAKRKSNKN